MLEGGNDEAAGDGSADGDATGAVAAAQFPRIFITTSMNDTRVLYVEPLKWLARLQSAGVDAVAKIEVEPVTAVYPGVTSNGKRFPMGTLGAWM